MSLPYSDPSNPALPSPLFSDLTAVRGDHMRANNAAIFADLTFLDTGNPALVALTGGSFKTAALANANTYTGRSTFSCSAGVSDTPSAAAWHISGIWNPTDSSGHFIAMLDTSLETWEINYTGGAWGTWTKHTDSNGNQFANAFVDGFNSTATSGGTLTLTVASAPNQFFTGSSNHTVTLPVANTLQTGFAFYLTNTSTGTITVNSSGGNLVSSIPPSTTRQFLCILASGTDAASWFVSYDAVPVGHEMDWGGLTPPVNYIARDGASLLRASYPALFAVLCPSQSCTMTIANPCVVTANGHGLTSGMCVSFESSGSLPTSVGAFQNRWVTVVTADTFKLSATVAAYVAGTYIDTHLDSQSGSHTLRKSIWGITDATHFNVADERGIGSVGAGIQGTASGWVGTLANHVGVIGYYEEDQLEKHFHNSKTLNTGTASGGSALVGPTPTVTVSNVVTDPITDGVNPIRTGAITKSARVGKLKVIKYQ
jgi:hypothetical protein